MAKSGNKKKKGTASEKKVVAVENTNKSEIKDIKQKTQEKQKVAEKQYSFAYLIPAVLAVALCPILVFRHSYDTGYAQFEWFASAATMQVDFFMWIKMVSLNVLGVAMLLIGALHYTKDNRCIRFNKDFIPLFVAGAFALFSACTSKYSEFSFKGNYEMFESVTVLLVYVLLVFYTYNYSRSEKNIKTFLTISCAGFGVSALIGAFQYIGDDVYNTKFGKMMITADEQMAKNLSFSFPKGNSYSTFYNPDFMGFVMGFAIIVAVGMVFVSEKIWQKILFALLVPLAILSIMGADATGGILAIIMAVGFGVVVFSYRNKKVFITLLALVIAGVGALSYMIFKTDRFTSLKYAFTGYEDTTASWLIKNIETKETDVVFYYDGDELHYSIDTDRMTYAKPVIKNAEGIDVETTYDEENDTYTVVDEKYGYPVASTVIADDDNLYLKIEVLGNTWYFTPDVAEVYKYNNPFGKLSDLYQPDKVNWFNETSLSGRGRIWNSCVPLLKKHIILGCGANNFVTEFPHNDYYYKIMTGTVGTMDVKAHCWYLQIWIENGLICLIAMLVFYFIYVVNSVKLYSRMSFAHNSAILGFAVFIGSVNYMIMGLTNDSNVTGASVYWGLIGIGMAINKINKEKFEEELEQKKEASEEQAAEA